MSSTNEQVLEQLRKIQEQEDLLYGKQAQLPFGKGDLDPETESLLDNSENPELNKKLFYRAQSVINIPRRFRQTGSCSS